MTDARDPETAARADHEVFISYARPSAALARAAAAALRAEGRTVWFDEALPARGAYAEVIEARLRAAKAVLVLWSSDAARSHWVRAEAEVALKAGTLVQISLDGVMPPLPFNQLQCADLSGVADPFGTPGWRRVAEAIHALGAGQPTAEAAASGAPAAAPVATRPSLAVLPFANITGDPDQDYFADGMAEEIATALSRIKSLFVIAGSSSRALKGARLEPAEVARTLGVRYLLEGAVRKAAGRVRISVGLVDTAAGARIWSERFEDTLEDVFALQDRVALAVAGVIEPAVQRAEIARVLKRPTLSLGSYDLYLRALSLYQTLNPDDVRAALGLLEEAIALDPANAVALALAANAHAQAVIVGWGEDLKAHRRHGLDLARRALQAAPDDPEVLARVVAALWHLGENLNTVAAMAARATVLNPGSALAWGTSGWIRLILGDAAHAADELRTAMRLDPISANRPLQMTGLALALFCERRFAEAVALAAESAHLRPSLQTNHALLAAAHGHLGEAAQAQAALDAFAVLSPEVGARHWFGLLRDADCRRLALEGLDLAEGVAPPSSRAVGGPAAGQPRPPADAQGS